MAYEGVTYERILQRMMDRVTSEYPDIDTREGSILFNALAPAALELAIMYTELDSILSESFVGTASREYLLIACQQMGMDITVFAASNGVHKGAFDVEVPIGSVWNYELYNYTVTEYIGVGEDSFHEYKMICDTAGSAPNKITGSLTAITYISNDLRTAEILECLIEGEDETSDDAIRDAYRKYVGNTATDGNVAQYEQWCKEYPGIGNYKVTPFPYGNEDITVRVQILSASNGVASQDLIDEFQNYLDPNSEGMGNGVAPIGSRVEVSTADTEPIVISVTAKMKEGCDTSKIVTALNTYFASIALNTNIIPYMTIGAVILSVPGVESISELNVNGQLKDVDIPKDAIPTLDELIINGDVIE